MLLNNKTKVSLMLLIMVSFSNVASARYLQSDPIGLEGGVNTYSYVENNPLGAVDPRGLTPEGTVKGAAIGAVVGGVAGGFLGGVGGAGAGTLVAPGVGTVTGGVAGGSAGAGQGAIDGAIIGGVIGNVVSDLCADKPDCKQANKECIEECRHLIGTDGRTGQSSSFLKCKAECLIRKGCNSL